MQLSKADRAATVLVAAIAVPYVGYLVFGSMPFVFDARAMAATGLGLGLAACAVGARFGVSLDRGFWLLGVLGAGTVAFGVAALVTERPGLLAAFMAGVVLVWALSLRRHAALGEVGLRESDQKGRG
jgi:hypothetical protein